MMEEHPERLPDEVYLGNFTPTDFYCKCEYKTKRLGEKIYNTDGNVVPAPKFGFEHPQPGFVKREEYDKHMARDDWPDTKIWENDPRRR